MKTWLSTSVLALRSSMAGVMISMSSFPNAPFSPACGLSPQTAMRGAAPCFLRWQNVSNRRPTLTISEVLSDSGTVESGTWIVTSATVS